MSGNISFYLPAMGFSLAAVLSFISSKGISAMGLVWFSLGVCFWIIAIAVSQSGNRIRDDDKDKKKSE